MSHWAGHLCTIAKVSLLLLLVSAVFFQSSLSERVPVSVWMPGLQGVVQPLWWGHSSLGHAVMSRRL